MRSDDYQRLTDSRKIRRELENRPYYNPVKENIKKGFRFVKLFWLVIVAGIILWVFYTWGDDWGLHPS